MNGEISADQAPATSAAPAGGGPTPRRYESWIPSWELITAKNLELRKRRGLMVVVLLLTIGFPVIVLGLRLLFHAVDPKGYGPAGTPATFQALVNPMAEFGFIIAATLGATAGAVDLTEGVFRQLVVTGRSRVALYLSRIPAGLAIVLPLVALAFTMVCLVISYEGIEQPASVTIDGISVPANLGEAQLEAWFRQHPQQLVNAISNGPPVNGPHTAGPAPSGPPTGGPAPSGARLQRLIDQNIGSFYSDYANGEPGQINPAVNEMAKIGLWLELDVGVGFLAGLGLGSLVGQRTVSTVVMIVLEIVVTPILAATTIPYFLDGQRLFVGIALDQLRPAGLAAGLRPAGPGKVLFGGRGVLNIPPMPTWAMITVIVGWIAGWSVVGAWRMATRDA